MILTSFMIDFLFSQQCCWRHRCLGYDSVSLGKQMMMMMMTMMMTTTMTMTMNRKRKKMNKKKEFDFFLSTSITHIQVLLNIIKVLNGHMLEVQSHYSSTHIQCKLIKFIHQATCLRVVWRRTRFSPTGRGHGSVTTGRGRSARGGNRGGGEHHSHCSSRASTKVPVSTWPHWQRHCAKPIQESGRLANTTPNW